MIRGGSGSLRPIEILLVEDNDGDVRLTVEAFKDAKLANQVEVAGDGEKALARLRRHAPHEAARLPDLILLDLNLPKVSGQEVLSQLQADPTLVSIPVVVLTASDEEHEVLRSLHLGTCAYMTKPIDLAQLIAVVAEVEELQLSIVLSVSP